MKTEKPHLTFLEKIVEANPHATWEQLAEHANAKSNSKRYTPAAMQRSANRLNLKLAGKLVPKPTKPIAPPNVLRDKPKKVHPAFNLGRIIEYRLTMSFCGQELVGKWRKEPMSQFHKDCEAFAINRVWFTAEFKRE